MQMATLPFKKKQGRKLVEFEGSEDHQCQQAFVLMTIDSCINPLTEFLLYTGVPLLEIGMAMCSWPVHFTVVGFCIIPGLRIFDQTQFGHLSLAKLEY